MMPSYLRYEKPKAWLWWIKHHVVSVGFIALALLIFVSFLWGKSSVIIMESHGAKPFKAGVQELGRYTIKSEYKYRDPMTLNLICTDGVKILLINDGLSSVVLWSCE